MNGESVNGESVNGESVNSVARCTVYNIRWRLQF